MAATAVPVTVSLLKQRVRNKTLRRPTVSEAEGAFIVHLLNPRTLKKQLEPI
jgi:hypothetical protein